MKPFLVIGATAVGGYLGGLVGVIVCPDWGELGTGAMGWAIGGAIFGAFAGAGIATVVLA